MDNRLTPIERKIVSEILSRAAEEFSERSSNDYGVPATDENRAIVAAAIQYNRVDLGRHDEGGELVALNERNGEYFIWDDWLMTYFEHRCRIDTPMSRAEVLVLGDLLATLGEDDRLFEKGNDNGGAHFAMPKAFVSAVIEHGRAESGRPAASKVSADDEKAALDVLVLRYLADRCKGKIPPVPHSSPARPANAGGTNMHPSNRPGINERWSNSWKAISRKNDDWLRSYYPRHVEALKYYADHGALRTQAGIAGGETSVVPPFKSWEDVGADLRIFSSLNLWKWEKAAIEEKRWRQDLAATAFMAAYLSQMIDLYGDMLGPRRFPGRRLQYIGRLGVCFAALGVVMGIGEKALRLSQLQLAACRKGYFDRDSIRPITAFIIRLLSDYLHQKPIILKGDPPNVLKDEVQADPVLHDLFEVWRDPDPRVIAPRCLAACDIHTHQAVPGPKGYRLEFGSGLWTRTPIAVLLVFRLRRSLGLENPQIDHPVMDSAIGTLPDQPGSCEPDELVKRVYEQMKQQGFSEEEILAGYEVPLLPKP